MIKKTKNSNAKIRSVIIAVTVFSIVITGLYTWSLYYKGPLTYNEPSVPFTFDYPNEWKLTKTTSEGANKIVYTHITATDQSADEQILSIRYYNYNVDLANEVVVLGTDCKNKHGNYEQECSYVSNPSARNGYFYSAVGSTFWEGELLQEKEVDGKSTYHQTISIRVDASRDRTYSGEDTLRLVESIRPTKI